MRPCIPFHLSIPVTDLEQAPHRIGEGTPDEHAKYYLADPSDNLIEIKAYRDPERTLHL